MTLLFELDVPDGDVGYRNLRKGVSQCELATQRTLEEMWVVYEPYADPNFRSGFAHDPEARFWEMFLGCQLVEAGHKLLSTKDRLKDGGQPDLCVIDDDRRIWIEAIVPEVGKAGPDQVRGPKPINEGGGLAPAPLRQAQLRITSVLLAKSKKIAAYLDAGVIAEDEPRLIAIGLGRFGVYVRDDPPLVLSSVFPIGPEVVTIARDSGKVLRCGFEPSHEINRSGEAIPRNAFLDRAFASVSGIISSRVSIGNMSRELRPISFVHNPVATVELSKKWGVWDQEFVANDDDQGWTVTDILARESNNDV